MLERYVKFSHMEGLHIEHSPVSLIGHIDQVFQENSRESSRDHTEVCPAINFSCTDEPILILAQIGMH